jgi:secreted trypsin-like serine protease
MRWLLFLSACSSFAVERAAIIGGTRDTGDPSVVMLVSYPPDLSTYYTCTASVIAPTVLVTAAHCVDAANHPGYSFGAFLGDDASTYATASQIAAQLVPASSVHPHPSYDPTAPFLADIAVVQLASAVAPAPLPLASSPPVVNAAARLVGYGEISYPTFNAAKYSADTMVMGTSDDTVIVGDAQHHTCVGDSGGPALVGGVVIGVDSYTDTTGCTQASHFRRVDLYRDFLDPYVSLPDLALADSALSDLSGAKDLSTDLASEKASPDLATRSAMSGGCQEAPGRLNRAEWLWLWFWLLPLCRRRSRSPAR